MSDHVWVVMVTYDKRTELLEVFKTLTSAKAFANAFRTEQSNVYGGRVQLAIETREIK